MAVIFEKITHLLESRMLRSGKLRYGCQPFDNLSHWICVNREIEEWMDANMKRKSGIKVKYTGGYSLIRFENENDALLFKMRWL